MLCLLIAIGAGLLPEAIQSVKNEPDAVRRRLTCRSRGWVVFAGRDSS